MINRLFARSAILLAGIVFAGNVLATFHLYRINELYSNADGSVQFIELAEGPSLDGQNLWNGVSISVSRAGATTQTFTFSKDLPSFITHNTSVLIATQGFADLGIVTPDFIVPAGFLFTNGGTVNFGNVDFMPYTSLPTDGVLSLNRDLTTGVNSPKNFAGIAGTVAAPATTALNFVSGWNLAGNSSSGPLVVAALFGDATKVSTVWKWIASTAKWAFYAPSLIGSALTDYASSKGYDVVSTINGGEGFWVNATIAFTANLPAGTAITSTSFQTMAPGWNLIAIGDGKTPGQFSTVAALTSLWAWDASLGNWYFYASSLDNAGTLSSYITSKGYLGFGTKALDPSTGFWVNVSTTAASLTATTTTTTTTIASTTTTTIYAQDPVDACNYYC